jgi:hypothetical protein
MKFAVLTGGGDSSGMNAFIRAIVRATLNMRPETSVWGVLDGWKGEILTKVLLPGLLQLVAQFSEPSEYRNWQLIQSCKKLLQEICTIIGLIICLFVVAMVASKPHIQLIR